MLRLVRTAIDLVRMVWSLGFNKKGAQSWVWVVVAIIIAATILIGLSIYMNNDTSPIWEVEN